MKYDVRIIGSNDAQDASNALALALEEGFEIVGQSECPPIFYPSGMLRSRSVVTWTQGKPMKKFEVEPYKFMVEMETDQETGITTFSDGHPPQQERRCLKCGHWSCPCCRDWCDVVTGEGDDADACCGGECTYTAPPTPDE